MLKQYLDLPFTQLRTGELCGSVGHRAFLSLVDLEKISEEHLSSLCLKILNFSYIYFSQSVVLTVVIRETTVLG